ncbi:MAG: hypothetical protein AMXMBFR22_28350 [Phycisphaerae bacterium]
MRKHAWVALALCALAGQASGQGFLSELLLDPPSTDNGQEFVEIQAAPNFSFSGWWFLVIEGDGTGGGVIDVALNLSSYSTGANGLLLIRDSGTVLQPPPDGNTNVVIFDFNPDIENGTNTYVLGFGGTFTVGQDLDAGNDGTLDAPLPGFTTVDAVSYKEFDGTPDDEHEYADDLGGTALGRFESYTPDALHRIRCGSNALLWAGGVVTGTSPGPYNWDTLQMFGWQTIGVTSPPTLNPGNLNYSIVDCDGDCVSDFVEGDRDDDGIIDDCDACPDDPDNDADGDGACGNVDNCPDVSNKDQSDRDGDGAGDACDGCPDDPNKTEEGACGCGVSDDDADGDGTPDCHDGCPDDPNKTEEGACGCGVSDDDADGDGTPDCHDGCPDDPNKTEEGACGCGVSDDDADGDGTPDCNDGCPDDPNKTEEGACGCGVSDDDTDGDGVADCVDNCPDVPNPGQEDSDENGVGDACESGGDCTGLEFLQMGCKLHLDNTITVVSKLFNGRPGTTVTFRLDDNPMTDFPRVVKDNGRAKVKFFRIPNGRHFVDLVECGVEASITCGPQP